MVGDPIADFITQLKNASLVRKEAVSIPYSKLKMAVAETLLKNGFIKSVEKRGKKIKKYIDITLKYNENHPEVTDVKRISKPGKRIYFGFKEIRSVKQGNGIMVISTPKGLLTDREAREQKVGGEVLFSIW
ncbi:MAG: 30S ribosomal protein S8 [Patescibacteria group bacterium]